MAPFTFPSTPFIQPAIDGSRGDAMTQPQVQKHSNENGGILVQVEDLYPIHLAEQVIRGLDFNHLHPPPRHNNPELALLS